MSSDFDNQITSALDAMAEPATEDERQSVVSTLRNLFDLKPGTRTSDSVIRQRSGQSIAIYRICYAWDLYVARKLKLENVLNVVQKNAFEIAELEGYRAGQRNLLPSVHPIGADALELIAEIANLSVAQGDGKTEMMSRQVARIHARIDLIRIRCLLPDAVQGRKSFEGGRKGDEIQHGTAEEKELVRKVRVDKWDEIKSRNPKLKTGVVDRLVAGELNVSVRTIARARGERKIKQ